MARRGHPDTRRRGWGRRYEPVPGWVYPERDGALLVLFSAIRALFRTYWHYRSELAPFTLAFWLIIVSAWLHPAYGVAAGVWTGVATVAIAAGLALIPARWTTRFKKGPDLSNRADRINAVAVVTAAGGWTSAAAIAGPWHRPLLTILIVAAVLLGVPWWIDHRRRGRVEVDRQFVQRWDGELAEKVGLLGSRVMSAWHSGWGYTARIALRGGQLYSEAVGAGPRIESALDTRHGAVRIEPDPDHANQVIVHVVKKDPHAQPLNHPGNVAGPVEGVAGIQVQGTRKPIRRPARQPAGQHAAGQPDQAGRQAAGSIARPVTLGVFADGQPVKVSLLRRHVLIGGTTGSGKSGVLNVILYAVTACADAVVWGIDLKQGMELRPWADCLARLATTPQQATELLRAAVAELDRRAALMAEHGAREWTPHTNDPALVVVIDEYAELDDVARELADSIARRGRAVAVNLIVATQRPTQAVMGGGAVRSQMDVRICLRVRERRDTDLILGQGMLANGWQPHTLDAAGKFLLSAPEHTVPRPARAYWLPDQQVTELAHANAEHRPAATLIPAAPDPDHDAVDGPGDGDGYERPATVGDPEAALWAVLSAAPDYGATVAELLAACGMSRPWLYQRLTAWQQAGRVHSTYRGRWRATPAADTGTNPDPDDDAGSGPDSGNGDVT